MREHTALTRDQHLERGRSLHRLARPGARVQGRPARDPAAARRRRDSGSARRFDIKAFHAIVLGAGAVTLPVLADRVNAWIETQVATERSASPRPRAVAGGVARRRHDHRHRHLPQDRDDGADRRLRGVGARGVGLRGRAVAVRCADVRRARRDVPAGRRRVRVPARAATAPAWATSTRGIGSGSRRPARSPRTRSARRHSSAACCRSIRTASVVAITLVVVFTGVNCLNVRTGGWLQTVLTVMKVVHDRRPRVRRAVLRARRAVVARHRRPAAAFPGLSAFGAMVLAALWAYDGWNNLPMAAGEVRDPQTQPAARDHLGLARRVRDLRARQRRLLPRAAVRRDPRRRARRRSRRRPRPSSSAAPRRRCSRRRWRSRRSRR